MNRSSGSDDGNALGHSAVLPQGRVVTRWRAAGVHVSASIVMALILLGLILNVWYPAPLFEAVGGREIFFLLLGVDVILGPLMTLVVFNSAKKSLKLDLTVIVLLQAVALVYGLHVLWAGRPVYVAALGHRFDVIQASEISPDDIKTSGRDLPKWAPEWVGIRRPDNAEERNNMMFSAIGGVDYGHKPQYHAAIGTMKDELLKEASPIADLRARNKAQDAEISAWLAARSRSDNDVRFLGLKARSQDMAVILDAKTAEVIGIAPFKPWD